MWLFGGGELFRSLLDLGLVDTIEVGVIPVILGGGIPLLPPPASRARLTLTNHRAYPKTGTVSLEYAVKRAESSAGRQLGRVRSGAQGEQLGPAKSVNHEGHEGHEGP